MREGLLNPQGFQLNPMLFGTSEEKGASTKIPMANSLSIRPA